MSLLVRYLERGSDAGPVLRPSGVRWRQDHTKPVGEGIVMTSRFSRRDFARAAACGSLSTLAAACSSPEPGTTRGRPSPGVASQPGPGRTFPKGFYWGVATS